MSKSKKEKIEKENNKENITAVDPAELINEIKDTTAGETSQEDMRIKYDSMKDLYLRKVAEFENYKRRTDAEKTEFFSYANHKLIGELLPVLDDFERILKAYNEKHDTESLKKGVELVYDKFTGILAKQGLKEIDSDGKEFDVNLHEALFQQPDGEKEPNTVLTTHEKGYFLKDKVLRHAKVIVSTRPDEK